MSSLQFLNKISKALICFKIFFLEINLSSSIKKEDYNQTKLLVRFVLCFLFSAFIVIYFMKNSDLIINGGYFKFYIKTKYI